MRTFIHIFMMLLAMVAGAATACPPTPGATCSSDASSPASQALGTSVNLGAGNPINVINGNKYQREEDMPALPGVMGLEIVRHYNSSLSGPDDWTGRVGRGWRLSYETRLVVAQRAIEVQQADGARLLFSRDALKPSVATPDDPAHGTISVRRGARGDDYLWRWADGRELSFNHQGQLVQIKAATGEITSLMYDPKGPLIRVTDPQGRSMSLAYLDRAGSARGDRFRGVQSIQTPVGRFTYDYGSVAPQGLKLDPRHLLANLVRVGYPQAGQGRRYHYEDGAHPTFMTGISIEGASADGKPQVQRYATYGYNAAGKGILSTHANGVDKVALDFEKEGVTTITNSLGQKTTYRYAGADSNYRLIEVRGAGCSLCGTPNQRYRYDPHGRLVETMQLDAQGMPLESSVSDFDSLGRTLSVSRVVYHDGKPGRPQVRVRYLFEGNAGGPRLIARPSVVPGREWITEIVYGGPGGSLPVRVIETGHVPTYDGKGSAGIVERSIAYRYNARGQRTGTDGPLPNAQRNPGPDNSDISLVQYEPRSGLPSRTVTPGNMITAVQARDEALRPIQVRSSDGYRSQTTSTTYNWRGQPTEIVITAALLDKAGADVAGSDLKRVFGYSYDAAGRLVSITAPGGQRTAFFYDDAGRLVQKMLPDGSRVTTARDTENRLVAQGRYADSNAGSMALSLNRFSYDSDGRLAQTEDGVGLIGTVRYTSAGQVARESNALGTTTRFEYDESGLLQARTDGADTPDAARLYMARDSHGQMTALTDANGVTTIRRYDDFGRKVAEINPDRGAVLFRHDAAGHVIARVDETDTMTSYSYDQADRLIAVGADQVAGLVQYGYQGRHLVDMTSTVDGNPAHANERAHYQHNALGQVIRESRWVEKVDHGAAVRKVAASRPGLTFVTDSQYDVAGRLERQRLPDGHTITYCYGAAGQLLSVLFDERIVVTDIAHTQAGGLTAYTMHNGVRQRIAGDGRGRVTTLLAQAHAARPGESFIQRWWRQLGASVGKDDQPVVVYGQTNRYDLADRVQRIVRQHSAPAPATTTENFTYDALDRLTSIDYGSRQVTSWRYDQGGNRLAQTTSDGELAYHYRQGSNRLLGQTSSAPTMGQAAWLYHDTGVPLAQLVGPAHQAGLVRAIGTQRGALTSRRIAYNNGQRPVAVFADNGRAIARYSYNGLGERIAKTVYPEAGGPGDIRYSLYREQRLAAETDSDGHITAHYLYLDGKPVAKIEMTHNLSSSKRLYQVLSTLGGMLAQPADHVDSEIAGMYAIHTDHLGTPQTVTDDQAQPVWRASTTPFGLATVSYTAQREGRPFEMNLRLPGQVYDAETGLNQNYLRDYDPQLGRYTSADPLGLAGGINPYVYADSNPLVKTDPLGLYEQDVHYYITYFLARVAGVDARMSYLIATGAQYIDDNPVTQPMKEGLIPSLWQIMTENAEVKNRLARYHFTQTPDDDKSTEMETRYKNPANHQLSLLVNASYQAERLGSECAKAVMYGEYLHAFEDTFAHRSYDNLPIAIHAGFGHATDLHFPDHTYNEDRILGHNWRQNESRTIRMQREVFDMLKGAWGGGNTASRSFDEIQELLTEFNKKTENSQNTDNFRSPSEKISLLNNRLKAWGYDFVNEKGERSRLDLYSENQGQYNDVTGRNNRLDYYRYNRSINENKMGDYFSDKDRNFDGVILK